MSPYRESCKLMRRAAFPYPWTSSAVSLQAPHFQAVCVARNRNERNPEDEVGSGTVLVSFITAKKGSCMPQRAVACVTGTVSNALWEVTALLRRWRLLFSDALAHISSLVSHPRSPKSACQGRSTKSLTQGEKASSSKTFVC